MLGKGGISGLMKQAQEMQNKMSDLQEEVNRIEVDFEAGGGWVKLTLRGSDLTHLRIAEAAMEDREMLEDLIVAAYNGAQQKMAAAKQQKAQELATQMGLPAGMQLPF